MRLITKEELDSILQEHSKWLLNSNDGKRADLSCVDLRPFELRYANLRNANLEWANLEGVVLTGADLQWANLIGANLEGACLQDANLSYAHLINANLCLADLKGAILSNTDFRYAKLYGTDLSEALYQHAVLSSSIMTEGQKNKIPMVCPSQGSFIGWKKVRSGNNKSLIAKLLIPEDALRSSGTGRKCRCSKAEVLGFYTLEGKKSKSKKCFSMYDKSFEYEVGKTVKPTQDFNTDRFMECTSGIHFFIDMYEAIDYRIG